MLEKQYQFIRQFISEFIKGANADAIIYSLAQQLENQEKLSIDINNQLYLSTATGPYLVKKASEYGLVPPPELGMGDDEFRDLVIKFNAKKQVIDAIHNVLSTFFGDETVRAWTRSNIAEPYPLEPGMELRLEVEDRPITITMDSGSFKNIYSAEAQEVSDAITRGLQLQGIGGYALPYLDTDTGKIYVTIYGGARGPFSMVRVLGGEVQSILEFPEMHPTKLAINDTIYQITKSAGSGVRFRWVGGSQPALNQVNVGDLALIYGDQFKVSELDGTYTIKAIRAATTTPTLDTGWFEVDNPRITDPLFNIAIPIVSYEDLKFYTPKKNVAYSLQRYALAFEAEANLIKIYMPATTKVVKRELEGSAHLHLGYDSESLNGVFGHVSEENQQIEVLNDYCFRYPSGGSDNYGIGGSITRSASAPWSALDDYLAGEVVSYSGTNWLALQNSGPGFSGAIVPDLTSTGRLFWSDSITIEFVRRENGFSTVRTVQPHGIRGIIQWSAYYDYSVGDTVFYGGRNWLSQNASGPGFGGAKMPVPGQSFYWLDLGPSVNLSAEIVGIDVETVYTDEMPFEGPYVVDKSKPYELTDTFVQTREKIYAGETRRFLTVNGNFPNEPGLILLDLAKGTEEGPIKYFGTQIQTTAAPAAILNIAQSGTLVNCRTQTPHGLIPGSNIQISGTTNFDGTHVVDAVTSPTTFSYTAAPGTYYETVGSVLLLLNGVISTLLIDPAYSFKFEHEIGADCTLSSAALAYTPDPSGKDFGFYVTGTAEGRLFAEEIINKITALGAKVEIVIVYPNDIGLGDYQGEKTDREWIWS